MSLGIDRSILVADGNMVYRFTFQTPFGVDTAEAWGTDAPAVPMTRVQYLRERWHFKR
jgi:hypothetical protein